MPKLSQTQQAQRRTHILDAAELCFAREGFHRTTMQDICREAKISAGAVYVYFASKEALIDGIVERDREELTRQLAEVSQAPELVQGLEWLLHSSVLSRPPHKIALYVQMLAEAGRNRQVADAISGCEMTLMTSLTAMLDEAQRHGKVAASIVPAIMARMLLILGDGVFVLLARRKMDEVERAVPHLLGMVSQFLAVGMPGGSAFSSFLPAVALPAHTLADVAE